MITEIDITSGKILDLVDEKKRPVSISEVKSLLDSKKEFANRSINWLVQEGHVYMVKQGKDKYLCRF
jgi:hypothetical protein